MVLRGKLHGCPQRGLWRVLRSGLKVHGRGLRRGVMERGFSILPCSEHPKQTLMALLFCTQEGVTQAVMCSLLVKC